MRRSVGALALVLLVASGPALATHEGDDGSASWDVLSTGRFEPAGNGSEPQAWIWNPMANGLLPHDGELVGFARTPDLACRFLVLQAPAWTGASFPLEGCERPTGIGVSAVVDGIAIGCTSGTPTEMPVAYGVHVSTRTLTWTLRPQDLGKTAGSWGCGRAAALGGDVVLPLWGRASPPLGAAGLDGDEAMSLFVRLNATDGAVTWAQQVSAASILTDSVGVLGYDDLLESPSLQPLSVVVAGDGFVATADLGEERVLIQLRSDGEFRGVLRQSLSPYGRPGIAFSQTTIDTRDGQAAVDSAFGSASGHIHTASDGVVAYLGWGATLLATDAFATRPLAELALEPALGSAHPFLGPILAPAGLVVPMTYGVALVDPATMTLVWHRALPQVLAGGVWDVQVAADGNVLVVADDTRSRLQLHILEATSGTTLQQLPLPVTPSERFYADKVHVTVLPDGDGALVWERRGPMALVGPRAEHPAAVATTRFPALFEPVTLAALPPFPGLVGRVSWGDSTVQPLAPGITEARHSYQEAGPRVARWTWQDPETGLTWSTSTALDVGGTPPPELNFLQRAFSDHNRDMTWGIIGLVLAAFSGIGAVAAASWRRRGLAAELRRLDAIRRLGSVDPAGAAAELRDYRRDLRERAARGAIQGSEFASVAQEAIALSQAFQRRVLAPFEGRIDHHLRAMLDAAMVDGLLSPAEADRIGDAIHGELALTPKERTDLARILGVWTANPAASAS